MLRGLPASHTQPLVFENVSPPEISSLRLSRQAEEIEKGLLLNYHFWTCCQPAPPPVTGFDGSSNSTAGIRGKTIQSFGWRGLESGREKGEARMQSKLWGSNIIALSEVGFKKKKKNMACLQISLAENVAWLSTSLGSPCTPVPTSIIQYIASLNWCDLFSLMRHGNWNFKNKNKIIKNFAFC